MNLLEVNNLCKKYDDFELKDISFNLPKGYIMGYIGQNGAGKTTTINLITHLANPTFGEVRINGKTYESDPIAYKEMIGFIGDESYFPKEMTIKDIRGILKDFYTTFREPEFIEMIKSWSLPENKKIGEFSKGMKVKLMFASVFARDTKLLILDEATNGLDPVMRNDILKLLQDYIADGEKSILFSTHQLDELEQIADYISFIDHGKMLIHDTKDELLESYILIKGDNGQLNSNLKQKLIGLTQKEYGFEAIISGDDATGLISKQFVLNKPSMNQLMIHFIQNNRRIAV